MNKIKNLADLRKMKDDLHNKITLRERSDSPEAIIQIRVGMATSGIASGAKEIMAYLIEELDKRNIEALVLQVGDMGYCYAEPTIEVTRPGEDPVVFGYVDIAKADEIIEKYIKNGEMIEGILPANYQSID
ncbi:MAG: (2Fe-2S) ferredoxin domain-containing protein [Bacteroidota bacterium]|jgi:NADP-reducing hydrogenase subunit HndB|nr:(2Fe-2S) ferredoxin domain-containing protein [Bacteroidales bacterium]MDI9534414.1 (2Fe-2S) ferredoxin domain-containing protein [Bacteroidota bacterium]OQC45585.1 MAG: NADP-reducing hydrogenase subunit HndB [Bacteroidetes bacterium ADurb.Bin028]NLP19432.1 (2Fe-2S) ferredoxin domain-containing protein [Bacteroidales bacterium]HNY43575.1 (2Fe-2S) ferredoxin domain-containing protein [Bacteroidales bacterium]